MVKKKPSVKVQAVSKKTVTPKAKAKFKPDTKKGQTSAEKAKVLKARIPTKMGEGELEAEDTQDVLTEEEELLMAEQEKKRAQRKKKLPSLRRKLRNWVVMPIDPSVNICKKSAASNHCFLKERLNLQF